MRLMDKEDNKDKEDRRSIQCLFQERRRPNIEQPNATFSTFSNPSKVEPSLRRQLCERIRQAPCSDRRAKAERGRLGIFDGPACATLLTIPVSLVNTSSHVGLLLSFCAPRCKAIRVPWFHPAAACAGSKTEKKFARTTDDWKGDKKDDDKSKDASIGKSMA